MGGGASKTPSPSPTSNAVKRGYSQEITDGERSGSGSGSAGAGGVKPRRVESSNEDGSNVNGEDSKGVSGTVDMQQLAFGDSTPGWGDQRRDYDKTLKDRKRQKSIEIDWKESDESAGRNREPPRVAAPPKQPQIATQGSGQGSKMSRPSPTPKLKPAPPAVSPYKNSRNSTPSHTPVKKPMSQVSARSQSQQPQPQPPIPKKDRNVNLKVNTSSGDLVAEAKSSTYQENVSNILKKASKYADDSDDSDSDCYDEEGNGDDSVYDWTTSNTNTSNCVTKVAQVDSKIDLPTSVTRPSGQGKPPTSQQQRSRNNSDCEDDMFADFGNNSAEDTFHRHNNVPKLKIPASAMSATPPQGPHKSGSGGIKPAPPKGMPTTMNMKVGIPTPQNGPAKSKMTPTPVRKQPIHHQPSPPNSRGGSQGKRHEVKETRDVKRNRAQIPSALKHVKPTTGDWLKKRYIVNNYIMLDVLGTGSYGEVRMCKERTTDELFGIKILSKEMLKKKKGGNTTETYFEDIKREIAIMKKLEHPNVLRLFEVLDDPNVNKLYLVLEYMKNGDLLHFIKERDIKEEKDNSSKDKSLKRKNSKVFSPLRDQELWFIFKQVIAGVRYLHYQNIVHGDIKPQNILVSEDGTVKLADFGISKMLENGSNQKLVNAAGTPAFMSPELCEAAEAFSGQLADVWAIGATMFMLRFGAPPFVSGNIMALYNKIINDPLEFPAGPLDPGLRNLLVNMLEKDPKRRYTTDQVTSHPWMRIPPSVNDSRKNVYTSSSSSPAAPLPSSKGVVKSIHFNDEYVKKEAKAMKGPLKIVGDDDLFTSIGFGTIKKDEEVEEDDDDELLGDDIMTSDWGLDVFEKVDAEDSDSAADSDDDDESVDSPKKPQKPKFGSKLETQASNASAKTSSTKAESTTKPGPFQGDCERSAMDDKELDRRSKNFMSKMTKKPSANFKTCSSSDDDAEEYGDDELDEVEVSVPRKRSKDSDNIGNDEDNAESMSMDDFEKMMDTLAMRPVSKSNLLSSGESTPHQVPLRPRDLEVSSEFVNAMNGVGGVYHSEQGCRKGQEDRCFLLISPGMYNKSTAKHSEFSTYINVENLNISMEQKEHLHSMSIAGVFDGHSGSKCAQFLLEKYAALLVSKKALYSKNKQKDVLMETCREMDAQVCEYLFNLRDSSGSTGVVMLYDGRSRVLTVANVGDSMCVLSRGGKAVKIHRTHRVGDEEEEVERVKKAGGTVVNKRVNGLLAISRAFGDTQFKTQGDVRGPVIATPDIVSEIITPMTEFAIAATDGLWDVIDPQAAVNFVKRKMLKKENFASIVQDLVNDALDRGSVDNVTAVIIMFHLDKKDN